MLNERVALCVFALIIIICDPSHFSPFAFACPFLFFRFPVQTKSDEWSDAGKCVGRFLRVLYLMLSLMLLPPLPEENPFDFSILLNKDALYKALVHLK